MDESVIDLGKVRAFHIGDLDVRPAELIVVSGDQRHELQPRIMQVLVALAKASPDVVSREELSNLCWGGRIVGDDALNRCILALRHLAEQFDDPPFAIQTIPRIGHRLVAAGEEHPEHRSAGRRPVLLAALAGLAAIAGVAFWSTRDTAPEPPAAHGADAIATTVHVRTLYQTASNLIRTRNRRAGPMAIGLLRDAVKADPAFAPAWARLSEATILGGALGDSEAFIAAIGEARGHARHALALMPGLAEGHRAMGGVLGFGTPAAVAHLRRAGHIDPSSAENLVGLGSAFGAGGDFEGELAAYRRAAETDPGSFRSVAAYAVTTAELGDPAKGAAIARRYLTADAVQRDLLLGKIAWIAGDYSEAIRLWKGVERSDSPRWSGSARRFLDEGEHFLRLGVGGLVSIPRPLDQRHLGRIGMTDPPGAHQWRLRNRNATAAAVYRDDNHVAAKLMLARGRWQELVAAFDGPGGLAGIRKGDPLRPDQVIEAPVAAIALRQVGRTAEADRLLADAATHLSAARARGQVPPWLDVDQAAILALQGNRDAALRELARAIDRGWRPGGSVDLDDFAAEPAFTALRTDPRFQRLAARLAADADRERREVERLLGR